MKALWSFGEKRNDIALKSQKNKNVCDLKLDHLFSETRNKYTQSVDAAYIDALSVL